MIDGVQGVSTILSFVGTDEQRSKINSKNIKELKLQGLKKIEGFNDKKFKELPLVVQTKFKLTSIKVTTLSDKVIKMLV